jgi:hypothetical protein
MRRREFIRGRGGVAARRPAPTSSRAHIASSRLSIRPRGEPQRVRSAHSVTRGQGLRANTGRFLVTADLHERVRYLPESIPVRCEVRLFFSSRCAWSR